MKFRTDFSLDKLTRWQIIATVFTLCFGLCPVAFAVERGKQMARETATRAVGIERADSLLNQMRGLDFGTVSVSPTGEAMTLARPEGTYVFNDMARDADGNLSGVVTVYDANGALIAEINLARIAVFDDNRIDFNISASTAAGAPPTLSWVGSMVGINDGAKGVGMALIAANGGDTRPMLLNYGSLAVLGTPDSSLPLLSTIVSSSVGGVADVTEADSCEPPVVAFLGAIVAACIAVVVVVVVVVMCYAYCAPRICC